MLFVYVGKTDGGSEERIGSCIVSRFHVRQVPGEPCLNVESVFDAVVVRRAQTGVAFVKRYVVCILAAQVQVVRMGEILAQVDIQRRPVFESLCVINLSADIIAFFICTVAVGINNVFTFTMLIPPVIIVVAITSVL